MTPDKADALAANRLTADASPHVRTENFLDAWRRAGHDTDIEIRMGRREDGQAAVIVSVGQSIHAFTAQEARIVADAAEKTLKAFGSAAIREGVDNLILGLRAGADAAIRSLAKPNIEGGQGG